MSSRGTKTRASRSASTTSPLPDLAPDEVYLAVMASSDQLQHGVDVDLRATADVRVPRPDGPPERVGTSATRLPYHIVGSDASACDSCAPVQRCAIGSRVTGSPCTATTSTTRIPSAHNDSMLATNQLIWGFETNFGGARRPRRRQGQPADAQADPPVVGGGRGATGCVQRDLVPNDRQRARRAT